MLSEHHGASGIVRDPTAPNAVPAQKPHKLADNHISHNSEETEKQAVKEEGKQEVQLKERSPIDSKLTTCQCIKPCASQAFWVKNSKTFTRESLFQPK